MAIAVVAKMKHLIPRRLAVPGLLCSQAPASFLPILLSYTSCLLWIGALRDPSGLQTSLTASPPFHLFRFSLAPLRTSFSLTPAEKTPGLTTRAPVICPADWKLSTVCFTFFIFMSNPSYFSSFISSPSREIVGYPLCPPVALRQVSCVS